jgi:hypothetical protein
MKVESIAVHACKSTTRQSSPRLIRNSPNSLTASLFRKDPLPSQRIQLKPSNFPTLIGQAMATNDAPLMEDALLAIYCRLSERSTSFAIISCPLAFAPPESDP